VLMAVDRKCALLRDRIIPHERRAFLFKGASTS
jgi:hypothetical protein